MKKPSERSNLRRTVIESGNRARATRCGRGVVKHDRAALQPALRGRANPTTAGVAVLTSPSLHCSGELSPDFRFPPIPQLPVPRSENDDAHSGEDSAYKANQCGYRTIEGCNHSIFEGAHGVLPLRPQLECAVE